MQIKSALTLTYFQFKICTFCIISSNNSMVGRMLLSCFSFKGYNAHNQAEECNTSINQSWLLLHFNLVLIAVWNGLSSMTFIASQLYDFYALSLSYELSFRNVLRCTKCILMDRYRLWPPRICFQIWDIHHLHCISIFIHHFHLPP